MQNRFLCDIGDFGKYGLLRMLTGVTANDRRPRLSLGIVWYFNSADTAAESGRRIRYLLGGGHSLRSCDPELFDSLRKIATCRKRSIACIRDSSILPGDTMFFEEMIPDIESTSPREGWVQRALATTAKVDIVYLDPDNGLMPSNTPLSRRESVKYASLEEVLGFCSRDHSTILYHHLSRRAPAAVQIDALFRRLRECLVEGVEVFALRYHRGGARVFIILAVPRHHDILYGRVESMVERTPWERHFTLLGRSII